MVFCNGRYTDLKVIWLEREPTSTWLSWTRAFEKPVKREKQMIAKGNFVSASLDVNWQKIDWLKSQGNVRRLQARIVQATKEGRWNKVKALQHLLTRSFSAKALAVKRVSSNKGKWTSGIDGQVWQTIEKKTEGLVSLKQRGYTPSPLRRAYIPKIRGKKRGLGIPTMKDRAMQALYLMGLEPVAETTGDNHSYGFRRHRSTADAMCQIHRTLAGRSRPQWILEGDIKKCFDEINHGWLMQHIPIEKNMLIKWLKAGFVEDGVLYPMHHGTPQGGIISPVLANMTLDGLETIMDKLFGKKGSKKRKRYGTHVIRYADDFIVTGRSKEILETEVKPAIENFLAERGLTLSAEKTRMTRIEQGFDFLSQNVRKYKSKVIIKPSKQSVTNLLGKIRNTIMKSRAVTQVELINRLNPQIRGWAYYHRHMCARKTFEKIDHEIFTSLWSWAKRRHPNKSRKWIKEKYFKIRGTRQWCFGDVKKDHNGLEWQELFKASDLPIRRRIKIRGEANPFDAAWYTYFTERRENTTLGEKSNWKNSTMHKRACYKGALV